MSHFAVIVNFSYRYCKYDFSYRQNYRINIIKINKELIYQNSKKSQAEMCFGLIEMFLKIRECGHCFRWGCRTRFKASVRFHSTFRRKLNILFLHRNKKKHCEFIKRCEKIQQLSAIKVSVNFVNNTCGVINIFNPTFTIQS